VFSSIRTGTDYATVGTGRLRRLIETRNLSCRIIVDYLAPASERTRSFSSRMLEDTNAAITGYNGRDGISFRRHVISEKKKMASSAFPAQERPPLNMTIVLGAS